MEIRKSANQTIKLVTVQGGDEVSVFQPFDRGLKWPEVQQS